MTDANGNPEGTYTSLPFGDYPVFIGSNGDPTHFAMLEDDPESATEHAQYRQYSSNQGRWLSPGPYSGSYDPGDPQSFNRYGYVSNNPLSAVDPAGLEVVPCADGKTADLCVKVVAHVSASVAAVLSAAQPYLAAASAIYLAGKFFGWWGKPVFHGSLKPRPQTQHANCQARPLNLSQNIQTTKGLSGQLWSGLTSNTLEGVASAGAAAGEYVGLVQTGGPWDPKNWLGIHGSPLESSYTAAGNINFGATCSQFGGNTWIGGQACQYGAGLYGKFTGNYGSPLFSKYHGDWPADNQQIRQGLETAKKGGC